MLSIFAAAIVVIAGITASELCDESLFDTCIHGKEPPKFPESAEDLVRSCEFALGYLECSTNYGDQCEFSQSFQDEHKSFLKLFQEICDEDTLLHAAVVDNLKCFSGLAKELGEEGEDECFTLSPSSSTLHQYAETLSEEGFLNLPDDETEIQDTYQCIRILLETSCYATKIDKRCGTIAMDTFVEILTKIEPVPECGKNKHLLHPVMRLYNLEKEKEETSIIETLFKKRK